MREIKLNCIVEGKARGEVLYSSQPIAFLQGVDPDHGLVNDPRHEIWKKSFAGKILIFPNSVGSSVGAYVIYRLKKTEMAPRAMINQAADIITASGCAIAGIPLFELERGSIEQFATAEKVIVNGESSVARIYDKAG